VRIVTVLALHVALHNAEDFGWIVHAPRTPNGMRRSLAQLAGDVGPRDVTVVTGEAVVLVGSEDQEPLGKAGLVRGVAAQTSVLSDGIQLRVRPGIGS
jgi:hypothetical protein